MTYDQKRLTGFLEVLELNEEPMGVFFTDKEPQEGFSPKPLPLPTREREAENAIDWHELFENFSCVMGNIWRARKKHTRAWFSAERFGCPGGAFWLGFMKPQTQAIIHYVSTGIPNVLEGEQYCSSAATLSDVFDAIDPVPAPAPYCVVQPLSLFEADQTPQLVQFYARPESLCGLHQLAFYVTDDPQIVASPWGAACTGCITWPMRYLTQGEKKAVVGGWDPSARKFLKTDELSFTVPWSLFQDMLQRYEESFLCQKTWGTVRQKAVRSKTAWKE